MEIDKKDRYQYVHRDAFLCNSKKDNLFRHRHSQGGRKTYKEIDTDRQTYDRRRQTQRHDTQTHINTKTERHRWVDSQDLHTQEQITAKLAECSRLRVPHIYIYIYIETCWKKRTHVYVPTYWYYTIIHMGTCSIVEIFGVKEQTGGMVVYVLRVVLWQ